MLKKICRSLPRAVKVMDSHGVPVCRFSICFSLVRSTRIHFLLYLETRWTTSSWLLYIKYWLCVCLFEICSFICIVINIFVNGPELAKTLFFLRCPRSIKKIRNFFLAKRNRGYTKQGQHDLTTQKLLINIVWPHIKTLWSHNQQFRNISFKIVALL